MRFARAFRAPRFLILAPLTAAVALCTLLLAMTSLPTNSETTLDRAAVEKIVADYIAANGEALRESLIAAERRERLAMVADLIDENTPVRGPAEAPVTIIEFGDFECPFCARVQPTMEALREHYGDQVRFAFKQLPLAFHPNAKPAAYAALAAKRQGKYWDYADSLWARADSLNDAVYVEIAQDLKLNMRKFNADRADPKLQAIVERDLAQSQEIGARGTPFFLINGEPLSGALPEADFRRVIDAALAAAK